MPKCPICVKPVSNNCRTIVCDLCLKWCHFKCLFLTLKQYNAISVTNELWICQVCCHNVFPFHVIDTSELLELTFNSNTECYCSFSINFAHLENLPQFDFISHLPNISDHDSDLKIPSLINYKYYTPHDFHSSPVLSKLSHKSLSFLHCNISSLSANFDNLHHMLNTLDHSFNIIDLSGTWVSSNEDPFVNPFLPGFDRPVTRGGARGAFASPHSIQRSTF